MKSATAFPVFYRTYSRFVDGKRETWKQVTRRVVRGLTKLGHLTQDEAKLLTEQQLNMTCLTSGRYLWVGGTKWAEQPENFPGSYNCSSTNVDSLKAIASIMDLAMMGCGTGANLEARFVSQIPMIQRQLNVSIQRRATASEDRRDDTTAEESCGLNQEPLITIFVGDSRKGWVDAYLYLLCLATEPGGELNIVVDLSAVRPVGEKLKGFGGTANPIRLADLFVGCAKILNSAVGRQLSPLDCCKLIDTAAMAVVAGNIRRSAGIRQFEVTDSEAITSKDNLWQQIDGVWSIDPERDMLRLANHTVVYHHKPTLEDCKDSVRKQYHSGEGAIMWAGEAVARANADILCTKELKKEFVRDYPDSADKLTAEQAGRYGLNPCGEVVLQNNFCNLSEVHLNNIDPLDTEGQKKAFQAAALSVAVLLNHKFVDKRYQESRESDPIVGVSFTGLFDFFVAAFGIEWLEWWQAGRPTTWGKNCSYGVDQAQAFRSREQEYLRLWKEWTTEAVTDYCKSRGFKVPNRCTTVQPAGSKSLLTGASCGFHAPKAIHYIRRITFAKGDPVALACIDHGYAVVPSQSDKDADGNLLDDPHSDRCTEWLVEIPVSVPWADLPGVDSIDLSKFSALAQFDFAMQVQNNYVTHNLSSTIELRESEIDELATAIYQNIQDDGGYISAALLARFDDLQTFPRLPFEPIDRDTYLHLSKQVLECRTRDFKEALDYYDSLDSTSAEALSGAAGCDGDKCLLPSQH